ncbi:hypothetical protein [uncultured Arenimonas sp.]|uniref:hypothetical protein n=1 Tax=uncultured Arenimonas sp. TaxID=546226 RepID=UPI0030D870CD
MDAATLLEHTRTRLRQHEGQYAQIARGAGLSYSSLTKFAQGHANNLTVVSLQQLIEALDAFEGAQAPVEPVAAEGAG